MSPGWCSPGAVLEVLADHRRQASPPGSPPSPRRRSPPAPARSASSTNGHTACSLSIIVASDESTPTSLSPRDPYVLRQNGLMARLDALDWALLRALQNDARQTNRDLARPARLPATSPERVRGPARVALTAATTPPSPSPPRPPAPALISVSIRPPGRAASRASGTGPAGCPSPSACSSSPARRRLPPPLAVPDIDALYAFVIDRLTERPEVVDVQHSVAYEHVRRTVLEPLELMSSGPPGGLIRHDHARPLRRDLPRDGPEPAGIAVPPSVVARLGAPAAVRATIGDHSYRSRVSQRGGEFRLPLSAANRARTCVAAGDEIYVTLEPHAT